MLLSWLYKILTGRMFTLWLDGGGDSAPAGPTQQNVTQTNIPEYARPYVETMLGRAQSLTQSDPFTTYGGQRLAGFTPLQSQAFGTYQNMAPAGQLGTGTTYATNAGIGGLNAQGQYTSTATSPGAMSAYMSPYMQNVIDVQKNEAIRDYGRQLPMLGGQASKLGAYGGSRHAIVESEAQRNLQNNLMGIQARGMQDAWKDAQQSLQYGSGLGIQGLGIAGNAANTLGQIGQTQYGQQMGIAQGQMQAGAQQQALEQQGLDNQYKDFLDQRNWPYRQIGFMSDVLHGMPLTQQSQSVYQAPPSTANQMMAYGLGAYGLSNLFGGTGGKKAGGRIKVKKKGARAPRVLEHEPMGDGIAKIALDKAMRG